MLPQYSQHQSQRFNSEHQLNCILNLPHAIFSEQGHWKIENTVTLYGGGRIPENFVEPEDNEDFLRV